MKNYHDLRYRDYFIYQWGWSDQWTWRHANIDGGGWIGKVRWERSLGAGFDPKAGFDAEDVAAHWQQICDFEGAAHPKDNIEAMKEMMANLQKYAG